jgi:hypothetical protein
MRKTTLYIGLNDKDLKVQKLDTLECTKIVYNILFAYGIEGATIYNATGVYKHEDGTVVTESTLKVELFDVIDKSIGGAIASLKIALNQESIIRQDDVVTSEFV